MSDLQALREAEPEDRELVPTIIPVDARITFAMGTGELTHMVSRIASMVPAKEVMPGTAMMLVEAIATSDAVPHVRISCSDGDQWMQVLSTGAVRVLVPGSVVVPAKKILAALKLAPARVSKFSVVGNEARLLSGRAQWQFATSAGDRLAVTPQDQDVTTDIVPAGVLRRALKAVSAAGDPQTSRAAFAQAHVAEGEVTATDGARLHRHTIDGFPVDVAFDIPLKVVSHVLATLDDLEPGLAVRMGANEHRTVFEMAETRIIAQRVLLPFPASVEQVLTGAAVTNEDSFTVETQEFLDVIGRVRVNADPDYYTIYLGVIALAGEGGGWGLAVRARDPQGNSAQEIMNTNWSANKGREFAVNHKHLVDMLKQVQGADTIVRVGPDTRSQKSAFLVEDGGFKGILSQTRTDWIR